MLYQLHDGLQIFESGNLKKLIVRSYGRGVQIEIDNQDILRELLMFLKDPRTEDEIKRKFHKVSDDNLKSTLEQFTQLGVVNKWFVVNNPKLNILIIGLGTVGSHLISGLCRNDMAVNLFLVDPDKVDETNIFRQDYTKMDIGKYKIKVFQERFRDRDIKGIIDIVDNCEKLERLCQELNISFVIQCADYPSTTDLGRIVSQVCNSLDIPYIINPGYMSNVISLPEFYYPNTSYNFSYKREVTDYILCHTQFLKKAEYTVAIQPTFIMLKQLEDYILGKKPIHYQNRGYFSKEKWRWEVERIE